MSVEPTVFHKIVAGELPADVVYEDDDVLVFKDIHPLAPTHWLLIAKKEADFVASIADVDESTAHVPGMLIAKAQQVAKEKGIDGYKLQFCVGEGGGQSVFYLHLHLMSDQALNN